MNNETEQERERRLFGGHKFLEIETWNDKCSTEVLTSDQLRAFRLYQQKKNLILMGEAGTGKTYLLSNIRLHASSLQRQVIVAGTTGISVVNVGGDGTMHSLFGLGIGLDKYIKSMDDAVDIVISKAKANARLKSRLRARPTLIIIDEISMADNVILYMAMQVAEHFIGARNIQWILVGDPLQLPPVKGSFFWEPFQLKKKKVSLEPYDFEIVQLREQVRQRGETEFIEALNQLRMGQIHPLLVQRLKAQAPESGLLHLYFNNESVMRHNEVVAAQLKAQGNKSKVFTGKVTGDEEGKWLRDLSPIEPVMELVIGQKFMVRRNGDYLCRRGDEVYTKYVANGNIGVIKEFITTMDKQGWECEGVLIELKGESGNDLVEIPTAKMEGPKDPQGVPVGTLTQLPGHASEALTIHKCQGLTIKSGVKIHPWQLKKGELRPITTPALLYVAASRVTKPEDLYFDTEGGFITAYRDLQSGVIANQAAIDWLAEVENAQLSVEVEE